MVTHLPVTHGGCLDQNNDNNLPFNYVPSFAAGIVFVVLFSLVTSTFSPSTSQAVSNESFPSGSPRTSTPRQDVVATPNSSHRRRRRDHRLGWPIMG